jgi:hypothetical protein
MKRPARFSAMPSVRESLLGMDQGRGDMSEPAVRLLFLRGLLFLSRFVSR